MRDIRLYIQLTFYYLIIAVAVIVLTKLSPEIASFIEENKDLPVFYNSVTLTEQGAIDKTLPLSSTHEHYMRDLFLGTLGALILIFPVSWVYLKVRTKNGLNQALIKTMLILPIIVAGVVTIVQNSLALAFSLAGIVAAVRFRHTIRSSADTLFIFVSIGVGLAAGVNSLGVAVIMTIFFNYVFVILFSTNYGYRGHPGCEKYMRPKRSKKFRSDRSAVKVSKKSKNNSPSSEPE